MLATSPANPPPPFRLQISLRVLLIFMAAVCISLAVYRWPWEETDQHRVGKEFFAGDVAEFSTTSTYHRNWRGEQVLHGPQRIVRNKQLRVESHFYDGELHGPRRVYDQRGRLLWEAHYRGGRLHGRFRAGNGEHWYWWGEYRADDPHGDWEFVTYRPSAQIVQPPLPTEFQKPYFFLTENAAIIARRKEKDVDRNFIVQKQSYQRGQRHGVWKWETLEGELLNRAEYKLGDLVRWNGEDIEQQFWKWLVTAPLHPEVKRMLHASEELQATQEILFAGELSFRLSDEKAWPLPLSVFIEPMKGGQFHLPLRERALVPMLCELACTNGYAFDCRYGLLWLVPHADPGPAFVDRTGVMKIQFPAGSFQARDWLAEVDVCENYDKVPRLIEAMLSGSSIRCTENFSRNQARFIRILDMSGNHQFALGGIRQRLGYRIPRRDAIGLALYRAGFVCRQGGDEGIILDHGPSFEPATPVAIDPFLQPMRNP